MYDAYPEGIIYGGAVDAWKTAPVAFEVCWVMGHWHDQNWDTGYIFDEAVNWHMSYFNTKSSPVAEDQWPAVYKCLKRMGYRYALRKFAVAPVVRRGAMMRFHTWWENQGCAPIYRRYDLALELKGGETAVRMKTDADVTTWLPGDIVYDGGVAVPGELPTGKYTVRLALVDTRTGEAKVKLPIEGLAADGWYDLGEIKIVPTDERVEKYEEPGAP